MQEYDSLEKIIREYKWKSLDSTHTEYANNDTVYQFDVDTIIFSPDKKLFFSFVVQELNNKSKIKYSSDYCEGQKVNNLWNIVSSENDLLSRWYRTPDSLRYEIWQNLYRAYSINGSSGRQEIWKDSFLFYFPFHKR